MGNFPKAKAWAWLKRMVIYYMVWMHGKHKDMEHMAFEPIIKGWHASMPSMHISKSTRQGPSPYALGLSPLPLRGLKVNKGGAQRGVTQALPPFSLFQWMGNAKSTYTLSPTF